MADPVAEPTVEPTVTPSPEPTSAPSPAPTPEPTTAPKVEPTAEPSKPKADDGDSLLGKKDPEQKAEPEPTKVVPEKYEFKVPEGMQMDEGLLEKATPVLKELGLDQNEAGKLFNLMVEREQANVERWNKQIDTWKQETMKELGENAEAELANTSKFIDKFGGKRADAIRTVLNDTGLGSHPDIVHLFREAGKFHSEDTLAMGSNKNQPSDPENQARKMFPNTKY